MGRRQFIKMALVVLALVVVINLFRLGFVSYPAPDTALEYFTDKEYAILKAAADTLVPGTLTAPSASALRVPAAIDHFLATSEPELGEQFRQLVLVLEHGTTVFGFKFRRFTEMTRAERTAYLARWRDSDLDIQRQGYVGLKKLVNTFYFIDPGAWKAIGYPGPRR